jgi:hypothetical protein
MTKTTTKFCKAKIQIYKHMIKIYLVNLKLKKKVLLLFKYQYLINI